jgi:TolB-like protein/Tfp pilus assembly protein PilF
LTSILRDSPPPITRSDLPGDLKSLIQQCLAKDAAERIQSARLLAKGLREARTSTEVIRKIITTDDGFWVAVLPFKYKGSNADIEALAEGLSDEILTGLSRFSYLRVIASGSPSNHARYVIEGTLRLAGTNLRLAVQLVDKTSGTHIWAETYDRPFRAEDVLSLQDELVPRIVSTVADQHGVLVHSIAESLEAKSDASLTPHEAVLGVFRYLERITPEEHARARAIVERAVERAPDQSDCWAAAGLVYAHEYAHGFSSQPDLLDRALSSARRAVELRPSSQLAHDALALTLFHRRETRAFRAAAERAIALNPMNGTTTASMGLLIAYSGDWEAGCAIVERAAQLNPHHPGWYHFPAFFNAYLKGEYRTALDAALRNNMPGYFYTPAMRAAAYGQLGEHAAAQDCVRELLALKPDIAATARREFAKWYQPELVDLFIDGLRKAGLEIEGSGAAAAAPSPSGEARSDDGFWVAVLPFKATGASPELTAFAEGLSEEIVTALSRFSYLRVLSQGSSTRQARYVMEGSIRQAGSTLRLAVQFVDKTTGTHIWAETYNRLLQSDDIFAVQDELVLRIVSTVADQHGVLPHSIASVIRGKPSDQLTPYEAVLRVFSFHERMTPEEHAELRDLLERIVKIAPNESDCWASLANLYSDEHLYGFKGSPDPLGRAAAAARRAVELAPSSTLALLAVATPLFFSKEFAAFRPVAERALLQNRADGALNAFLGFLIACSGDWERGCALVDAALPLNPHHPGWYWLPAAVNAYRKRDYRASIEASRTINMPGVFWGPFASAAAYGQLGETDAARKALKELLEIRPDFAEVARVEIGKWFDSELVEHFVEGLSKAGLAVGGTSAVASPSGQARAAGEGFWVAVLPFKSTGPSPELAALAEGLSEEIVTGLSRFSYLRVIARGSTLSYANKAIDLRVAGKELGARYVMEGTLRQAGAKLRLAVQLVDAVTGAHLWAENYERAFSPEAIFELQDDLVPRIVSTVADNNGALPRSMSEAVHSKAPEELSPYEAVLRSFAYFERYTPEELSASRAGLEAALRKAPAYADAWAMLACLCAQDYLHGYELQKNALESAASAARKAVELSPANHLAYFSLAQVLAHQKDFDSFQDAAERVLALNPMDGNAVAFLGEFLVYGGNAERGMQLADRAKQLNPNHPGFYWFADFYHAFSQKNYRGAVAFAQKAKLRGNPLAPMMIASAAGQLGDGETAAKAASDLLKFRPELPALMPRQVAKIWNPEYGERFLDGLRKAGIDIPGKQAPTPAKPTSGAVRNADSKTPSIAVLPFANMSADKDQEYFSDGLAEEIINLLAKIPGLKVIARTSAFAFRGKELDIRGIADALGVTHVLEGSVRRTETRLRVTGQLIDAADGTHLWSERYDREMSDIFALQDDIATAIAGALRVKLSPEALQKRYEPKLEAYEAYLKGKYLQAKASPEALELAKQCHERAIQLDPGFVLPRTEVGFYWVAMTMFGRCPADRASVSARAEAERALQLDPSLPDAYALSGYLSAVFDLDWDKAEQYFAFPGARLVGNSITQPMYGWFQYLRGNVTEAIALVRRAIEQDPLDVWSRMNFHAYLQAADREHEALEQLRKVLELDPNQALAIVSVAMIQADQGNLHEALASARRAHSIGQWAPETTAVLAALLYRSGYDAESQSIFKTLGSGGTPGDARALALYHLLRGEVDAGADWVERAINEGDIAMSAVYIRFVACKQLRASHRWPKIAKMVNLPDSLRKFEERRGS